MAEHEHEHTHQHMARGEHGDHEEHKDKDQKNATFWGLGIAAAGLVLAAIYFFSNGGSKGDPGSSSKPTVVNGSTDFIPNPTDISIGTNAAPLYWPSLPTSGTPTKPKTHHHGEHEDKDEKKKKTEKHHTNKSNDNKGYGRSPHGASHGHAVSGHNVHNPKTTVHAGAQHTKGKANG